MSLPRNGFTGSVDELHGVIDPFVTHVAWLHYQDRASDPVKPDILVAHKFLLRALTQISPNLSFNKKQLETVFERLQEGQCRSEQVDVQWGVGQHQLKHGISSISILGVYIVLGSAWTYCIFRNLNKQSIQFQRNSE